jgi:hypothetical protein
MLCGIFVVSLVVHQQPSSTRFLVHGSLQLHYCQRDPCVFNLPEQQTCKEAMFRYDISAGTSNNSSSDGCCALQDSPLGRWGPRCTMTVVGECHLSTRPGLIYTGSSSSMAGGGGAVPIFVPNVVYSVYANTTAATARNKTAAGCPTSWYDPLARPSSIVEQIPLATMRLQGVVGNLPDSNLWTNLTETHIVAFYDQSTTVRDLIVEIVPLDADTTTTGTSSSTTIVSYLLLSSYRGTDGAFRLDDPFVGEAVEPYLTALKQTGGPFYSTLTGVVNAIGAGPVVAPTSTSTTPAPTPNNSAVRLSSSSAAPSTKRISEPAANVASAIRTETIDTASSSSSTFALGHFLVLLSAMALFGW